MSTTICINLSKFDSNFDSSIGKAKNCSTNLSSSLSIAKNVRNRLDNRILNRKNINYDLNKVINTIDKIEGEVVDIRNFLLTAAKKYLEAEKKIDKIHKDYNLPYKKSILEEIGDFLYNVGKNVVKVAIVAVTIVVAIKLAPFIIAALPTIGSIVSSIFFLNETIATGVDIFSFITGIEAEFNPLELVFSEFGGWIGKKAGNEELGRWLGEKSFSIVNVVNFVYSLGKLAVKGSIKLANSTINMIKNGSLKLGNVIAGLKKIPQMLGQLPGKIMSTGKNIVVKTLDSLCSTISRPLIDSFNIIKKSVNSFATGIKSIFNKNFFTAFGDLVGDLKNGLNMSEAIGKNPFIQTSIADFKFYGTFGKVWLKHGAKKLLGSLPTSLFEAGKLLFNFNNVFSLNGVASSLGEIIPLEGVDDTYIEGIDGLLDLVF